ncbi:MAG TPA: flagellar motor protein MotA [Oceanicaulis sp.]|jgi:biopolymer transport protein ExbB|uniref:Biopolymer transporter ExbB n=1 Tax=Glycocaulis albus TaxID=1382801 RepID=A0ABQ1XY88_9PROT|nr:MotA/TolQ/ExbB proton channel family protein [Glycocaulis albus]MBV5257507.1 MotA/TolQ/ExbB proton channel family protein [Synechococcus moorigangaii CMS01]GGH06396.1 biopolymer transporter ExbB [Glycocaulis albus]HCY54430.1 flagellar motor protein MotA [Oceanicaulis sp.]
MKTLFKIAAAVSLSASLLAGTAMAQESQRQPVTSISQLLDRVRADARDAAAENQRRLQEFRANRDRQAALVAQARGQLNALEATGAANQAQFEANQAQIQELDAQLRREQGAFGELFGAARQKSGEFASTIEASIASAQAPGRHQPLRELSQSRTLPDRAELDRIWQAMISEMELQGDVVTFDARVSGVNDGQPVSVTRVGVFNAFITQGGTRYVLWQTEESNPAAGYRLVPLERQPPGRLLDAASTLARASEGEIVSGPIDPSRGQLLNIYKDVPNTVERFNQGGIVAQIILGLLIFSAAFGLFRLFSLFTTNSAINGQKRRSTASKGNPLGRIMLAYEEVKDRPIETIELKLDEAILRETPKLEFGLNFLKLAAAVAPLLGLLGTVTGMIRTFTQITLFGTGDPRIMAGGISEALVTTVMGLIAAIPLLFIHSFAASFARGAQQTLEEQAAGIVARHAEERAG